LVLLGDSLLADAGNAVRVLDGVWVTNAAVGGSGLYTEQMTDAVIANLEGLPIEAAVVGVAFVGNVTAADLDAPDAVVAAAYAAHAERLFARLREMGAARIVWLEPPMPLWPNIVRVPQTRPKAIADAIVARYRLDRYRIGLCPANRPDGLHFDAQGAAMYGKTAAVAAWHGFEFCADAPSTPTTTTSTTTSTTTASTTSTTASTTSTTTSTTSG